MYRGWKLPRARDGLLALGLASALVTEPRTALAQDAVPADTSSSSKARTYYTLTVQPRRMTTGTQNPAAGEYPLESIPPDASDDGAPSAIVAVPPQCVGAKRCPLFFFLSGASRSASYVTRWLGPLANRYGLILRREDL